MNKRQKKKRYNKKMTKVDAYYIPNKKVKSYIKEREYLALKVEQIFSDFCHSVKRDWAGSEDGEAIIGLNKSKEIIALVHLDPHRIGEMKQADNNNQLKAYLLEINDIQ